MARNGWTILAFAGGTIVGFAVAMPYVGSHMPDAIVSLVGSVAGSVATVGGAIVLWQMQERKTAFHALHTIHAYAEALWTNCNNVGLALATADHGEIVKAIERGLIALERDTRRVSRIHGQLHTLSASQSARFYELEALAEQYVAFCEEILRTTAAGALDAKRLDNWTAAMERDREQFAEFVRDEGLHYYDQSPNG